MIYCSYMDASLFWTRVDELRGNTTLTKMCGDLGMKYTRVRDNRSDSRFPSQEDIIAMAKYLNTSLDYLITGNSNSKISDFCEEAQYVQNNIEARALVRAIMDDPALLPPLSALATHRSMKTPGEKEA